MPIHGTKDAALIVTKALPAAGATNYSDAIDLKAVDASFDHVEVLAEVPALTALADTKTYTVTFEDSADNSTFATIPELATFVRTGIATGQGSAAASRCVRLPASTRRYLRVKQVVEASGGDNTAKSVTVSLLF